MPTQNDRKPLSRQFGEGGYTFLKRALAEHFNTESSVEINVGNAYLSYKYTVGDQTFEDRLTVIEENDDSLAIESLNSVAKNNDVNQGIRELGLKR